MALHRKFVVVGGTSVKRRGFTASAVETAYKLGWSGREFLVGFETSVVGMLFAGNNSRDALAVAVAGSVLERMATSQSVSYDWQDAIIVYDWYGSYPYFYETSQKILDACEECYDAISDSIVVVSCAPLDALSQEEKKYFKERSLEIVDLSDSPTSFARLIARW